MEESVWTIYEEVSAKTELFGGPSSSAYGVMLNFSWIKIIYLLDMTRYLLNVQLPVHKTLCFFIQAIMLHVQCKVFAKHVYDNC